MQPRTPQKGQTLSVALVVLGTLGILTLLFLGQQGSQIAEVLALLLTFLVAVNLRPEIGNSLWSTFQQILTAWKNLPKRIRLPVSAIFFILGIVTIGFFLPQGPVAQLADQAKIEGGDEMVNGSEAIIRFTEKIPNRGSLDLTSHLENIPGTGDCYQSSIMTLRPTVNGESKPLVNMKGREGRATIDIGREVRDLAISVKLQVDEGCRMKLSVTSAAFYD